MNGKARVNVTDTFLPALFVGRACKKEGKRLASGNLEGEVSFIWFYLHESRFTPSTRFLWLSLFITNTHTHTHLENYFFAVLLTHHIFLLAL